MYICTNTTNLEKKNTSVLTYGSIAAILLAIVPYLFYCYEALPDHFWGIGWLQTINESLGGDSYVSFWIILQKFVPVVLFTVWFLTCKHWWYHAIIIPLSMYLFQFVILVTPFVKHVDHFEMYLIVPVVIASLSASYLARIKIYDKIHGIDLSELEKNVKKPSDIFFKQKE